MIIAFVSIGFAEKLKVKTSIGKEMQNFYLDKHINYIFASVIVWTWFLSSSYFTLYNDTIIRYQSANPSQSEIDQRILTADFGSMVLNYSILFAILQGIILAVARTNEPIYKHLVFSEFRSWFGELIDPEDLSNDLKKNSASALMNK